jgi:hypothetical protein
VSEARDLVTQVSDALAFLRRYHDDLLRLSSIEEADELLLDFGIPQLQVAAQFLRLPAELVSAAGKFRMGLEISLYAISE